MKIDYDVVIVGAGPAGITAAIYLKRAKINCLVIEKDTPGGAIAKTSIVENYPGVEKIKGADLAMRFYNQIKDLQVPYEYDEVTEIIDKKDYKIIKTKKREITSKAVILCPGKTPKNLEKENSDKLIGKGISFCAVCDGSLYKNEFVSVVGGGSSALEEALYLSGICKKVYVLNRSELLRGDKTLVDRVAKKKNIEILYNTEVEKFNIENDHLGSITIKTNEEVKQLNAKACFIFIGYIPDTNFLKTLDILDEKGYIIKHEGCRTSIKYIYAAGDVIKKESYQIVHATSEGAQAAISCIKDLSMGD